MSINKKLKPHPLKKGCCIGLIAPAGPISRTQLHKAENTLLKLGFKSIYSERILEKSGYLAGTDQNRVDDLHEAFQNQDVDAILCIRGGYGSARIVEKIDFNIIKNNPKIFIGYSDITVLLNAFWQKTGLITFHGVVGTSAFSDYTIHAFNSLLDPSLKEIESKNNNQQT